MEPPAVTSCGVGSHSSASSGGNSQQHGQTPKRNNLPISFLQIEPQISFNTTARHFEELPENFLETISPQQHADGVLGSSLNNHDGRCEGTTTGIPQLASLTTVSMAGSGSSVCVPGSSGYANLISMPNSSHYISSLKMESMDHLEATHHQMHGTSQIEKATFGNGTAAGLLSPLQLESNRNNENSALGILANSVVHHHHHRTNGGGGRTSDLLSGIRRNNVSYIKEEEINPSEMGSAGYQAHDYETGYTIGAGQPTAQELERMANAETPPALSNVEITSSLLASLSRESQSSPHSTHFIVHQMSHHSRPPPSVGPSQQMQQSSHHQQPFQHRLTIQHHLVHPGNAPTPAAIASPMPAPRRSKSKISQNQQQLILQQQQEEAVHHQLAAAHEVANNPVNIDVYASLGSELNTGIVSPSSYHQSAGAIDPLNAEIDDEIYIDTKDLCKRVAYELKQHSIPQAIFAERILCRSQGTLSDLLRNPKPWNRLKSGRETFKRMYNWLQQPLHIRLSILDMFKGPMPSGIIPPPTPAQNSRHHHRRRSAGDDGQPLKRPRLVFTDIQKRTLQAIFKETQRPSREMQQTIAEHLRLDMSTVSNFFMNARRRSRNGNGLGCDEPAPYQQVLIFYNNSTSSTLPYNYNNIFQNMTFPIYGDIRTITPPPDTPPDNEQQQFGDEELDESTQQLLDQHSQLQTSIHPKSSPLSAAPSSAENLSLIEQTVDEVVCRSIAYARKSP
ncbi:One cut domain family member [Meloidogyne graminicola]|uniref:One cut domain family member n=1 Tax=Meloidogyne graminicola TaxID=189291 RepID=A0A8S9ZQ23_9BILA|nr:One cut domain family member [Meloidogyne graminicola]